METEQGSEYLPTSDSEEEKDSDEEEQQIKDSVSQLTPGSSYHEGTHSKVWSREELDIIRAAFIPHRNENGRVGRGATYKVLDSNKVLARTLRQKYPTKTPVQQAKSLTECVNSLFKQAFKK